MDLNRVQTKKNTVVIKVTEEYPDTPVLRVNAHRDNTRHSMTLNRRAITLLGVGEAQNKLIAFNNYDTSVEGDGSQTDLVVGIVADKTVKLDKNYKAYDVHLNTRTAHSKEIYTSITKRFDITDGTTNHYFELRPVGNHASGSFTLTPISREASDSEEEVELEVEFNKGENREVTEVHS